jgi:cellulose synthase/poly-beta-1,6-N-acetylglucosamine synthase-like glycosyltransferase
MQKAEYHYGNFIRQAMSTINSIHIAPGPFSFFRTEVFKKIGPYIKAHNTEDMEIAMRMQKNGMKIAHAAGALIHTASPENIRKLYKQRVRWVSGFFGNIVDYRGMLFNRKYGDLGILVLPVALAGIFLTIPFALATFYRMIRSVWINLEGLYFGGLPEFTMPSFDLFSINTSVVSLLSLFMLVTVIFILASSKKMTHGKWRPSLDFLYLLMYTFLAPFWLLKAIYNNIWSKQSSWR